MARSVRSWMRPVLAMGVAASVLVGPTAPTRAEGTPVRGLSCSGAWEVVPTPAYGTALNAVAFTSADRGWAVGLTVLPGPVSQTLIERWNGTRWSIVPSPNGGSGSNQLTSVWARSASDAWAAGTWSDGSAGRTLIEHWDGHSWTIVPSPSVGTGDNQLMGLSGSATSDLWAVGFYFDTGAQQYRTLTEHWDGVSWSVIPSADPATADWLNAVVALSVNKTEAVGRRYSPTHASGTLAERWNGSAWTAGHSPNTNIDDELWGVSVDPTGRRWAVGFDRDAVTGVNYTLILTRDTGKWTIEPSPNPGAWENFLFSVSADAGNDAWAVGYMVMSQGQQAQTLTEHWDGTAWSAVPSPSVGSGFNNLLGVVANPWGDAWAVGVSPNGTLIEHFCVS
jgi:hypothetical protein